MKKVLMIAAMSATLMAQSGLYVGADIIAGNEEFDYAVGTTGVSVTESAAAPAFKLKVGYGDRADLGFEIGLTSIDYDKDVYTTDEGANVVLEFDIIKAFDVNSDFYPFIKCGFGFGAMEINEASEESAANVSFKVGGGFFYALGESIDLEAGLDIRGRDWQDISILGVNIDLTSSAVEPYVGMNYRF